MPSRFLHELVSVEQAKEIIEAAVYKKDFLGTFNYDNANPERANKKFKAFLEMMEEHCDIKLPVGDFFSESKEEDGENSFFGHPPGLFTLKDDDVLLVVDYCFSLPNRKAKGNFDLDSLFEIAPDTIKFHKFSLESN